MTRVTIDLHKKALYLWVKFGVTDCGSEGDDFIMTKILSLVIIPLWKKHGPSFEDIGIYFISILD